VLPKSALRQAYVLLRGSRRSRIIRYCDLRYVIVTEERVREGVRMGCFRPIRAQFAI
jgi:hypothetical protein